jgi:hypothetical protein
MPAAKTALTAPAAAQIRRNSPERYDLSGGGREKRHLASNNFQLVSSGWPTTRTHQDKDMPDPKMRLTTEHAQILDKIKELYCELFLHDGFGELKVEIKFLKKKQKEIIIRCGKDYRFVVDYDIHTGPYAQH